MDETTTMSTAQSTLTAYYYLSNLTTTAPFGGQFKESEEQQQQPMPRVRDFDFDTYLSVRCVLSWVSVLVIGIGLVGNCLSFIVLVSSKMRIATNVFLASLCVSGFIALLGLLINSVLYDIFAYYRMFDMLNVLFYFYPYVYPLITTFQFCCILLTVCVSVNQFVCIYSTKLKSRSKKNTREECRTAFIIVLVMYVISIIYCIPYWLKFGFSKEIGLYETELGRDPLFKKLVHFWLYLPMAYIIPFSILIFTNTYLIGTLMLARKRRMRLHMNSGGGSMGQRSSTKQQSVAGATVARRNSTVKTLEENEHESLVKNESPVGLNGDTAAAAAVDAAIEAIHKRESFKRKSVSIKERPRLVINLIKQNGRSSFLSEKQQILATKFLALAESI
jgi:hypothetical protein